MNLLKSIKTNTVSNRLLLQLLLLPLPLAVEVLLLKNMVGPGDVDGELAKEVADECAKFGPVANCVVYEHKAKHKL
jgi:hypothetical protein